MQRNATAERDIQKAVQLRIGSRPDVRLWRHNTGKGWTDRGARISFGLAGSADLVGLVAPTGRFLGVEVRSAAGRQSPAQRTFQAMVAKFGGIYILARSPEDAERQLDAALAEARP